MSQLLEAQSVSVRVGPKTLLADVETAISTRYAKEVIALTTLVSVANAYFNVLDAQDRLRIARENFRASSRVLDLIRQRKGAGTASDLEVSQQESLVGQQRASIPPLEIIARQNKMALAVLVGRAPEHFILAGGSANRIRLPRVTPGLPSDLLDQRPDIREALEQSVPHPSRLGAPDDYGRMAVSLLENSYVNGETIRLDGAIRMPPR